MGNAGQVKAKRAGAGKAALDSCHLAVARRGRKKGYFRSAVRHDRGKADSHNRKGQIVKFLVTGGAGFMGINLVRFLLERGHEVRSWDIAPFTYPEVDRIEVLQGDIRDEG
ncbi:MAG: NAD-dependent epimerase/dehydratase family protein, partial [Roseovarius sp.]|nr:NAD-dependent epimerase/dehydratase family protein [Roseovarius sp.]